MNAFFLSQFSCSSLLWMFHRRKRNYSINKTHARVLRIVYNDHQFYFQELLERHSRKKPQEISH